MHFAVLHHVGQETLAPPHKNLGAKRRALRQAAPSLRSRLARNCESCLDMARGFKLVDDRHGEVCYRNSCRLVAIHQQGFFAKTVGTCPLTFFEECRRAYERPVQSGVAAHCIQCVSCRSRAKRDVRRDMCGEEVGVNKLDVLRAKETARRSEAHTSEITSI